MKRLIAVAVVVLLATGCATQNQQAQTEGTALGALGGALLGGAIGFAAGGARGAAIGAGVGALTGGAAGFIYANSIVKRREELAGREKDLDAQIEFARGVNHDTEEYNRKLAAYKSEIDRLVAEGKKQKAQNDELVAKKQELDEKVKMAKSDLVSAKEQLQELKNFKSKQPTSSKELDVEIKKLEGNLAQLERNTDALASLNARI